MPRRSEMRVFAMVCICVVGVLILSYSIAVLGWNSPSLPKEYVQLRDDFRVLGGAITQYAVDNGFPPPSIKSLVPRYLASLPSDPWNHPYRYTVAGNSWSLTCDGPDGIPNARDDWVLTGGKAP